MRKWKHSVINYGKSFNKKILDIVKYDTYELLKGV